MHAGLIGKTLLFLSYIVVAVESRSAPNLGAITAEPSGNLRKALLRSFIKSPTGMPPVVRFVGKGPSIALFSYSKR